MRVPLLFLSFCFFSLPICRAHFGDLKGTITDEKTNVPIIAAKIALTGTTFETSTDSSGKFQFLKVPASFYTVSVLSENYRLTALKVEIKSDTIVSVEIPLQSTQLSLPQVFVLADRPLPSASSKIINSEDFELRSKNSAQDLLRLVPGLFVAQHAGGGKAEQLFLRGFDCDHGTDVAIYDDGMPVNMPSHGHGQGYADTHFIIPETVEEMEVSKGPYSILNGDFATAGAIHFKTFDDLQSNKLIEEISSVPGNRNISANRNVLLLRIPINSVTASYFASDIFNNPGYFDNNQQMIRFNFFEKIKTQLTENSSLSFEGGGFGSSWNASGQIPERAVKNGIISRFGSIDPSEGGSTSRNYFNLTYHQHKNNRELDVLAFQSNYHFKLFSDFSFFLTDSVRGDEIEQTDHRSLYGMNARYSIFNDKHAMKLKTIIGGGFRKDDINNSLWHDEKRNRLNPVNENEINETAINTFIGEEINWTEKLKTDVGLRYDYFIFNINNPLALVIPGASGFNYQSLLCPKLNIIYSFTDQTQFFFNSGIGYHSNDGRSVVLEHNNHQLPLALGSEVGITLRSDNTILNLSIWNLDLENELVYSGDDGTTEARGPSRRTGIDASIRHNFSKGLYGDADINISHNRFLQKKFGNELATDPFIPLAPSFTSSGGLTYLVSKNLKSSIRYRFMCDRPANESNTINAKGYTVFEWASKFNFQSFAFGLTIENLLNTNWDEAQFLTTSRLFNEASPVNEIHFTAGTPRTYKLSVTYSF